MVVSPDKKHREKAYNQTLRLLSADMCQSDKDNSKIFFKNGSTIEFVIPQKQEEIIRGHRSQTPLFLNEDLDLYNFQKEMLSKINKPIERNDKY